jgi:hypothetical protein
MCVRGVMKRLWRGWGMKVKVCTVWNTNLEKYKAALNQFNATYEIDEYENESIAYIEIERIDNLFKLVDELKQDVMVSVYQNGVIQIYDDYIE